MRKMIFFLVLWLTVAMSSALAQFQWSGGGADRSWATAGNWTNPAAPPPLTTNRILFAAAGFGANRVDQNRSLFGPSETLTNGLHYRSPSSGGLAHTTDLQGFTLKLDGGSLMVGQNGASSLVTIANGILQLGGTNRTSVHVGTLDNTVTAVFNTSNRLILAATVHAARVGDLTAGYMLSGNSGRVPQGILDLSGATLTSSLGENAWKIEGAIRSGQSYTYATTNSAWSQIRFPASLTSLEAGSMLVGASNYQAWGQVDFGAGSLLTNLWVIGEMRVGTESAYGVLSPLTNLTRFRHGGVTSAVLRIGYNGTDATLNPIPTTTVVMAGGVVEGNWSELAVGMGGTGNGGFTAGSLDWRGMTTIHSGGASNSLVTPILRVGCKTVNPETAAGNCWGRGFLYLPSNLVRIAVGEFSLGRNNNTQGWLDIGSNSALRELTVTNGFYIGAGDGRLGYASGTNFIQSLPTGMTIRLGSAGIPIRCAIAFRPSNQHQNYGEAYQADVLLAPSNGVFEGYFSTFKIGCKENSDKKVTGILDLRTCRVDAFRVTDEAFIATTKGYAWNSTVLSTNLNGKGYLMLPDCDAEVYTNLYVGDYGLGSTGVLELAGGRVRVGRTVAVYPTGRITTRVQGKSAGLIMGRNNTNDLLISSSNALQLIFESAPSNTSIPCYALRMPGNQVAFFTGLTNSGKAKVDGTALPAAFSNLLAVYYNDYWDYTYIGIRPRTPLIENASIGIGESGDVDLTGHLIDPGLEAAEVKVCWGPADGGPVDSGLWAFTNSLPGLWGSNTFPSVNVTLPGGTDWYAYRFAASNTYGSYETPTSDWFMVGSVSVAATDDQASEIGPDPGSFTVSRDPAMTNHAIAVNYQFLGTALPGIDYLVSPAGSRVVLAEGVASATLTATPLVSPNGEPPETVILSLLPGGYGIGTATATVTIADGGASTNVAATDCGPWVGYGNGDNWGEAANWLSNAAPALVYTGKLVFGLADLGNVNRVETNRLIAGPSASTNHGLRYGYDDFTRELGTHTTDLGGNRLTLDGGTLMVGDQMRVTRVTITNGVLRIGSSNLTSVYVGYLNGGTTINYTGSTLRLSCTVELVKATNVILGDIVSNSSLQDRTAQGSLDCRNAVFTSPLGDNTMQLLGLLGVGYTELGRGLVYEPSILILPASLRVLDVPSLYVGYGSKGTGLLDFGPGSQMTNIRVRTRFHVSTEGGVGALTNMPSGLDWQFGEPAKPVSIRVGTQASGITLYQLFNNAVDFSAGLLSGELSELLVGGGIGGNDNAITARLDWRAPRLNIGGLDCLKVTNLRVGYKTAAGIPGTGGTSPAEAFLRLPPSMTNLTAGELGLGCNNRTRGWLDIGSNSALQGLTITNGLYLGCGDGRIGYMATPTSMVDFLPAGLTIEIGSSNAPAFAYFACKRPNQYMYGEVYPQLGVMSLTNGIFRGWFRELGLCIKAPSSTEASTGVLNLARADVKAFSVSGNVLVNRSLGLDYNGNTANSLGGYGYLLLPACEANVASNLYVGDSNAPSLGYLELNGTRLRLTGKLEVEKYGVVTSYVDGVSGGLDLLSRAATNCLVRGRIHVRFRQPQSDGNYYWGLRMAGDQRTAFGTLSSAGALSWSAAAGVPASKLGVWYDPFDDKTYVGMPKRAGSLILIR